MKREYHQIETPAVTDHVALAFRAVIAQVVLHNYEVAEGIGLSPRDMQAIHLLQLRGAQSPGELGRALGLASASTTALIDRLEAAGYVQRERDPTDRRKVVVTIVEARLQAELAPRYADQAEHLGRTLARFSDDELETIGRFLNALADGERP